MNNSKQNNFNKITFKDQLKYASIIYKTDKYVNKRMTDTQVNRICDILRKNDYSDSHEYDYVSIIKEISKLYEEFDVSLCVKLIQALSDNFNMQQGILHLNDDDYGTRLIHVLTDMNLVIIEFMRHAKNKKDDIAILVNECIKFFNFLDFNQLKANDGVYGRSIFPVNTSLFDTVFNSYVTLLYKYASSVQEYEESIEKYIFPIISAFDKKDESSFKYVLDKYNISKYSDDFLQKCIEYASCRFIIDNYLPISKIIDNKQINSLLTKKLERTITDELALYNLKSSTLTIDVKIDGETLYLFNAFASNNDDTDDDDRCIDYSYSEYSIF